MKRLSVPPSPPSPWQPPGVVSVSVHRPVLETSYQGDHAVRSLCYLAFFTWRHVSASCPSFLVSLSWRLWVMERGLGVAAGNSSGHSIVGLGQRLLRPFSDDAEMQTASAVTNVYKTLSRSASTPAETITCFLFLFVYSISSPKDGWRKTVVFNSSCTC